MTRWLLLFVFLLCPTAASAQEAVVALDAREAPEMAREVVTPYDRRLGPNERVVQVRVQTRRDDESLHLVVGYEAVRIFAAAGQYHEPIPMRRLLCTGPCTLGMVAGARYELAVSPGASDERFESHRFPQTAAVLITDRTVGLEVTFNPRTAQRRRRWLTLAGMLVVGGAMMGGSALRQGQMWHPAFSTGLGIVIFTPSLLVMPLLTFGQTEVRTIEAP